MAERMRDYVCSICGTTLKECKHWGPTCRRTRRRVCLDCCIKCEYHVRWYGLWRCSYITQEELRNAAAKRSKERFDAEVAKINTAYRKERREAAKRRAIKAARERAAKGTKK